MAIIRGSATCPRRQGRREARLCPPRGGGTQQTDEMKWPTPPAWTLGFTSPGRPHSPSTLAGMGAPPPAGKRGDGVDPAGQ
eukprot:9263205-Pyramimonas_sp.AAC.1